MGKLLGTMWLGLLIVSPWPQLLTVGVKQQIKQTNLNEKNVRLIGIEPSNTECIGLHV